MEKAILVKYFFCTREDTTGHRKSLLIIVLAAHNHRQIKDRENTVALPSAP